MGRASVDGRLRRKGLAPPGAFVGKVVWITGASQVTARTLCSRSGSCIFILVSKVREKQPCKNHSPCPVIPLPPISPGSRGRAGGSIRGARRKTCAVRPPQGCASGAHGRGLPSVHGVLQWTPSVQPSWRPPPPGAHQPTRRQPRRRQERRGCTGRTAAHCAANTLQRTRPHGPDARTGHLLCVLLECASCELRPSSGR